MKNQDKLPVLECFYSIQGEGTHSGKPAFFIRLAGCNVNCHWCDVKESWSVDDEQYISINQIMNKVKKAKTNCVVITGGEPLLYNLDLLTKELKKLNKKIHLETSGTQPLSGSFDWICFSPKKFKKPLGKQKARPFVMAFGDDGIGMPEKILQKCLPEVLKTLLTKEVLFLKQQDVMNSEQKKEDKKLLKLLKRTKLML